MTGDPPGHATPQNWDPLDMGPPRIGTPQNWDPPGHGTPQTWGPPGIGTPPELETPPEIREMKWRRWKTDKVVKNCNLNL